MNKLVLGEAKQFSNDNEHWTLAKIKYELETRRLSLAGLSRDAGYSETAAGRALRTPWPAVEKVIACVEVMSKAYQSWSPVKSSWSEIVWPISASAAEIAAT